MLAHTEPPNDDAEMTTQRDTRTARKVSAPADSSRSLQWRLRCAARKLAHAHGHAYFARQQMAYRVLTSADRGNFHLTRTPPQMREEEISHGLQRKLHVSIWHQRHAARMMRDTSVQVHTMLTPEQSRMLHHDVHEYQRAAELVIKNQHDASIARMCQQQLTPLLTHEPTTKSGFWTSQHLRFPQRRARSSRARCTLHQHPLAWIMLKL